ncbi:MAG: ribonuclease H-like YkuK family protein [Patescibacteria group bacterium]|nr:ribonuclease H-like YkuK family protein [Patescibacteria group bacterium]
MKQTLLSPDSSEKEDFFSPTKGQMSLARVINEIVLFIKDDPLSAYKLIVGTDSCAKIIDGACEVGFVTAVIIYRNKKGARYFWKKKIYKRKPVLRDKIYTETLMSLSLAHAIVPEINKYALFAKYELEIHIDVGFGGTTREMIKEVVGMVAGNGFVAKIKPESWGASKVADKHT